MAKDKVERSFRIYWDDSGGTARDLSGDLVPGSFSGGGLTFDEADMTGVSDGVKKFLTGHADSTVSGRFHMNDTASTGATTVFTGTEGQSGTLTLQWGAAGAAPTTGDPEWEGEYTLMSSNIVVDGNKFVHEVSWKPQSGQADPAWGTVT
jgi:hypothetical protein